jgi:formimidoylglutamate deiminase
MTGTHETIFVLEQALLPQGWCKDVLLKVDAGGTIHSVTQVGDADSFADSGVSSAGVQKLKGAVIPGMVNVHCHAFQRAMAGLTERLQVENFWHWRESMYRFASRMTPEHLRIIALQLYREMLIAGYTSVVEFHYLHRSTRSRSTEQISMSRALLDAAAEAGIGLTLLPVLYRHAGFGETPAEPAQACFINTLDDYCALILDLQGLVEAYPDANLGIAVHSLRAVPMDDIIAMTSAFPQMPVHMHIAEQMLEVDACLAFSGMRPVQWLFDHIEVDERWCLVHATHIDRTEIEQLAKSRALIGLCPSTEANLGDGVSPATELVAHGARLGIGSDSNICVNPLDELRLLEYSQRMVSGQRNRLTGSKGDPGLWQRLSADGSSATGRKLGVLASGFQADFVMLDLSSEGLIGRNGEDMMDSFMFATSRPAIGEVYVAGQRRVHRGSLTISESDSLAFEKTMVELQSG